MDYIGRIIRPPSEADSILLQVTTGCSHNKCTFCGTYRDKVFSIKDPAQVEADIEYAARNFKEERRLFLCDGDALIMPMKGLTPIFERIKEKLSWVERIGLYANAKSVLRKNMDELKKLKELGLGIVYLGLESGDGETLKKINKWGTPKDMVAAGQKIKQAGIKLSVTVLIGLAGREHSPRHARETGKVLSQMDPGFIGALTLMLVPGTEMWGDRENEQFELLNPVESLLELKTMIEHTHITRGLFYANHASNYLPVRARLPRGKAKAIALIQQAIDGQIQLRPEWYRGL